MHPERLSNEAYLSLNAPFRIFHHTLTGEIAVHWHEFYELAFVLCGEGQHCLNGTPHPLAPGAVFLLTPTDFHAIQPHTRAGTLELYNVIFSDAMLSDDLRALVFGARKHYHVQFHDQARATLEGKFESLWDEAQHSTPGYPLMIRATLAQILIMLARQGAGESDERQPLHHPAVQKALLYIDHHFREPLSLKMLAEQVHLAPNYLSELFQRSTGMAFGVYLQDVRLRWALALLQSSSVSVTEVCYTAGFGNLSHFTRAFKKKFGYSPRESRRLRGDASYERP